MIEQATNMPGNGRKSESSVISASLASPLSETRRAEPTIAGLRDKLTGIVHVSLGTHVGGMEKLLVEFARYADRERFQLAFVSLESRGRLAIDIEGQNWPVYAFDKRPGLRPGLIQSLARHMRSLSPSVVHTHNTAGFVYGVAAAKLARIPKIIHTRHGQRFDASRRETWLFRMLSRLVNRVVSVSEDGRQLTISEGVAPERTCTIRNGVDLERFPYSGPVEQGPAILVARLSPEKGVSTLIYAIKDLLDASEDLHNQIALEIVGDGAERAKLELLSQSLGLTRSIRFLGERNDIPRLLGNASMFVLPSLTEGISLTLLEAMARGLPVVATGVGGTPEVVVHERTGLIVPSRDPTAFAAAMSRIHQQPTGAKAMGLAGRKRVEKVFSIKRMVQEYEQLYIDAAPRNDGSPR